MAIIKSISISAEFEELAKEHRIGWSEAARVGLSIMLSEMGIRDYDNSLNLHKKMSFFKNEAEKAMQKLEELEKIKKPKDTEFKPKGIEIETKRQEIENKPTDINEAFEKAIFRAG